MTDKKFFWGICGWLFCLMLIFMVAVRWLDPMTYMDNEYASWRQQKDYIQGNGQPARVLFLGDSIFQAAVMPEVLGNDVRVLALGGATAIEMNYALQEYLKHYPKPEKVFMAFSPLHYANMESYRSRDLYFHYLPWRQVVDSQLEIYKRDKLPWFQYAPDMAEDMEYMLRLPTKYFRTIFDSRLSRGDFNREQYETIGQAKGHRYFGLSQDWHHSYQPYVGWLQPFETLGSIDYYLRDIISICQNNGIQLYIVQAPMHNMDYELITESGYLYDFQQYMEKLAQETGVPVEITPPAYDVNLFGDNLHVNQMGALAYSQNLKARYNP